MLIWISTTFKQLGYINIIWLNSVLQENGHVNGAYETHNEGKFKKTQ